MRSPSLILGSLVLAVSLQPLLAQQATDKQTSKLDVAKASGFDFARVSELDKKLQALKVPNPGNQSQILRFSQDENLSAQRDKDLCYNLQVYHFTREDLQAPRMTGSTTCTPARQAAPRSIGPVRYVPQ